MKLKTLLLLWLVNFFAYSQETPNFEIPNYAPKSPEAAAFLKYGEYPVDLSTGVPNISIPLYNVQLKEFTLPITLNYHASGIKVGQEATWVGLGWNLNFGAQIILNAQEEIDQNNNMAYEMPNVDNIVDYYEDHPYMFQAGEIGSQQLDKSRIRDVYQFSSPTASGSFYIRDNSPLDLVVFPPNAFKVEMNPEPGVIFKITDAAGNIYRFHHWEQYNAIEKSYRTETHHDWYDSAWYVTSIETANKEVIDFAYEDDGTLVEHSMTQKREVFWNEENCGCPEDATETKGVGPFLQQGGSTMTEAVKIKQITFNNGRSRILFNKALGREDLVNSASNSKLDIIRIEHKNPVTGLFEFVKGFDFEYAYFNPSGNYQGKRLKLTSLMDLVSGDAHTFTYSDVALPGKQSFAQDLFGYFNGASNSELIPKHILTEPINTIVGSANRDVNPTKNQAGTLTEIHYPTKGWTKFNYETNEYIGSGTTTSSHTYSGFVQGEGNPQAVPPEYLPCPGEDCPCSDPVDGCILSQTISFTVANSADFELNVNIQDNTPSGGISYHHQHGRVRLYRATDPEDLYDTGEQFLDFPDLPGPIYFNNVGSGTWYLHIESYGQKIYTSASVKVTQTFSGPQNYLGGGLRVKSIENYDFDNTLLTKKVFDYTDPITNKTSGKLTNDLGPNFAFKFTTPMFLTLTNLSQCPSEDPLDPFTAPSIDYRESYWITSRTRYGTEGNTVAYEYVKESMVDAQDNLNGYTLYKFNVENDWFDSPEVFIAKSWRRGELLEKSDYQTNSSTPRLLRKEVNTYADDDAKVAYVEGFKLLRSAHVEISNPGTSMLLPEGCSVPNDVLETVMFEEFNLPVKWHYLKNTEVTEYFYDSDEDFTTVVSNTEYVYSNPVHMQLSKVITKSSKNQTIESRYYYPGDAAVQSEPCVADLLQRNMLNKPVKTETFHNGSKVQEQKTKNKLWATYNPAISLILPEIMQTAKGDDTPENRAIIVQRDKAGNPVEVKQVDGTSVCYIWAYGDALPVAKIENVIYDGIPATLIQTIKDVSVTGSEDDLLDELDNLRTALPYAMVTTYTHKPLIGISSITDPRGYKHTYHFDNYGRLRFVKDHEGNILSEHEYHFKN